MLLVFAALFLLVFGCITMMAESAYSGAYQYGDDDNGLFSYDTNLSLQAAAAILAASLALCAGCCSCIMIGCCNSGGCNPSCNGPAIAIIVLASVVTLISFVVGGLWVKEILAAGKKLGFSVFVV
jgi:hypothetical protein